MLVEYKDNIDGVLVDAEDFFIDWGSKPSNKVFKALLLNSDYRVIAVDRETKKLVGFVTAITDGVISAYISFLEVKPKYQSKGVGTKLFRIMLNKLQKFYMVDLICDKNIIPFYSKFNMNNSLGMSIRNFNKL